MKLYSYAKCSTCKSAIRFLKDEGVTATIIDIAETPPSKAELWQALALQGNEIKKLFNTSGVQYRELKLKDRLSTMSTEQAIGLLSENGMLIKRPFLLSNSVSLVGFDKDSWKAELKVA